MPQISRFRDHLGSLFPTDRFFALAGGVAFASALGFWYAPLYYLAVAGGVALLGWTILDGYRLSGADRWLAATRRPPAVFSLGDSLDVSIELDHSGDRKLSLTVYDELPEQLQLRDEALHLELSPGESVRVRYPLRPTTRGVYRFGDLNLFVRQGAQLLERRVIVPQRQEVAVYPSIVGLKQFSLLGPTLASPGGKRRPRPVTKSYEFDQIKEYVRGDDLRNVNWKASARRGQPMVNTYEEERAQRIYSFIDKGRTMLMPFDGLSLLDHAINASLSLSQVVLSRGDRAGLLTFSDKLGDFLPADNRPDQLRRILDLLYRQREREGESDYDLLYHASRRFLPSRSLLLLFTNFESTYALDRVLPVLLRLNRQHVVVVILFENTEITALTEGPTSDAAAVYLKHTARRYLQERQLMALRIHRKGIKVVLTRPEELTGAVINRYLELKGRGI